MAQLYNFLFTVNYLLILTVVKGFADKIVPADGKTNIVKKEADTVSVKCSYESSSEYIWLYWYKQYPNSAPQFLLYKGARTYSSESTPDDHRFKAETTRDSTELMIRDLKLSDSALYHCALRFSGSGYRIYFGAGTKLDVQAKEKKDPEYYKLHTQDGSQPNGYCLATRFTEHSATDNKFPKNRTEAARFEGQGYYSRLVENATSCSDSEGACGSVENGNDVFKADAKTNFLSWSIFWLRVLFVKTIAFNVLMTLKVWMS